MRAPRILVVQHEDKCPPALFGTWLTEAGCLLEICRPYAGDDLPDPAAYDGWVVLGGAMGANDDAENPWLESVKGRIRQAAGAGLPTLGICLGHQLVAVALGGTVERNPLGQQIGLIPLGWTPEAETDELLGALTTPRRGVQWNDDIVTRLPPDAVLLAATGRDEIQAVRYAPTVWGVQLHPEVDVEVVRPWAASDAGSHETCGIDQAALMAEIESAGAELDDAWRPLAQAFAALAGRG